MVTQSRCTQERDILWKQDEGAGGVGFGSDLFWDVPGEFIPCHMVTPAHLHGSSMDLSLPPTSLSKLWCLYSLFLCLLSFHSPFLLCNVTPYTLSFSPPLPLLCLVTIIGS
ncbi:hypothetical protein FKM82_022876 [Ascaphus truei]